MSCSARFSLLAALLGTSLTVAVSTAQAAPEFGVHSFFAATCKATTCTAVTPASELFTQAGGHPNAGVTDFRFNTEEALPGLLVPVGNVEEVRVDLPPGLSVNPQALPQCTEAELATGPTGCKPETEVGVDEITTISPSVPPVNVTIPVPVYNIVPRVGHPAEFGFNTGAAPPTYLLGGVSWNTDYHEYFTIEEIPASVPLIESRLVFNGRAGTGFLRNPTSCTGPQTTSLMVKSHEGQVVNTDYPTIVGGGECNLVPFDPSLALGAETTQNDQPDGATVELKVPQSTVATEPDSADLKTAVVSLPEGMTLNPAAAHGLEACTAAQIGIGTTNPVSCPEASKIGSVRIETPTLPPGSLRGNVYLGNPAGGAITGPPYTLYLDAESARYGVSTRLRGVAVPNETTGRLTATFSENPQVPFSDLILKFNGGPLAPLANPLVCGAATLSSSLAPFSGQPAATPLSAFTVDGNGNGGACPSPLPFSLGASSQSQPSNAAAPSSFTLNLARADGQQYLASVSATLPPGLVGLIPSVPLCGEPQAAQGECPFASQIGTATVLVGAGPTPIQFSGPVALSGPYNGSPYGLSVAVQASAGPFNFGTVVVRAGININPFTARVNVSAALPTIVKGVPLRLKNLSVAINRQGFLVNPTNCAALATETTLGSTLGASESLSTPFQVSGCGSLAFKPSLTASTGAKTSTKNGASLVVKIGYPSGTQANIKSVFVTLPKQLPARLSTLQKACLEATFNANPLSCPSTSRVGEAIVTTPALPGKLSGPAFFVSHGGAAFPDLDLVLDDGGVQVILVGNTNITGSITTSNFASVPDVPISGFELKLPSGPNSALSAVGNLCAQSLSMPTTITAQSGAVLKQNTKIAVSGCGVSVVSHRTSNHMAILKVQAPAAGRVSGSASNLRTTYVHTSKAQTITIKVPLSNAGVRALRRSNHHLKIKVRVGFLPKAKGAATSVAYATVIFRG
jgi:hypothetical protein